MFSIDVGRIPAHQKLMLSNKLVVTSAPGLSGLSTLRALRLVWADLKSGPGFTLVETLPSWQILSLRSKKLNRQFVEQLVNGHSGQFGQVVVSLAEAVRQHVFDIMIAMERLKRRLNFAMKHVVLLGMNGLSGLHARPHVDAASNKGRSRMCVLRSPTISRLVPVLPCCQMIHTPCGLNGKHARRLA